MHKCACPQKLSDCEKRGIFRDTKTHMTLLKELQAFVGEMGENLHTTLWVFLQNRGSQTWSLGQQAYLFSNYPCPIPTTDFMDWVCSVSQQRVLNGLTVKCLKNKMFSVTSQTYVLLTLCFMKKNVCYADDAALENQKRVGFFVPQVDLLTFLFHTMQLIIFFIIFNTDYFIHPVHL